MCYVGNRKADIVFFGESPGNDEIRHRPTPMPFVGRAGQKARAMAASAGVDWNSLFIMNSARCMVDKTELTDREIGKILSCCRTHVETVLHYLKPKVIILAGDFALRQVLKKKGITKARHEHWLWSDEFNCWCRPTFHPAYILRNPNMEKEGISDLRDVKAFVDNGFVLPKFEVSTDYKEVQSIKDYIVDAKSVGIDTEGQGLKWHDPDYVTLGYSISKAKGTGVWVRLYEETNNVKEATVAVQSERLDGRKKITKKIYVKESSNFKTKIKELWALLESETIRKVMMNGNFDIHCFRTLFRRVCKKVPKVKGYVMDVQAAAQLLDENVYKMADLVTLQHAFTDRRDNYDGEFEAKWGKADMLAIPNSDIVNYAVSDADITRQVAVTLSQKIKKYPRIENYLKKFVMPTLGTMRVLEENGVPIDKDELPKTKKALQKLMMVAHDEAVKHIPATIMALHKDKNAKQKNGLLLTRGDLIKDALFHEKGFRMKVVRMTKSKKPSTDKNTRKELLGKTKNKKAEIFLQKLTEFSQLQKLISTNLTGFEEHLSARGLIHSKLSLTTTVTGRISSSKPNIMNLPKRNDLAAHFRKLIKPPKGWILLAVDESQSELRWMAHCARDPEMLRIYNTTGSDLHAETAREIIKMSGNKWEQISEKEQKIARQKAKACIAEGQLVLTDSGLIPIEKVSSKDRVWDGVEWVHHGGVIYKGIREVIEYDGLTATPDHVVYTEEGWAIPFGKAASSMDRPKLAVGGIGTLPIRNFIHDRKGSHEKQGKIRGMPLLCLRKNSISGPVEYQKKEVNRVCVPTTHKIQQRPESFYLGKQIRFYVSKVHKPKVCALQKLRGTGGAKQIQNQETFHTVDATELSAQRLQRSANRQNRQQRPLCSRKSTVGSPESKFVQHPKKYIHNVQGPKCGGKSCVAFSENRPSRLSFQLRVDGQTSSYGNNGERIAGQEKRLQRKKRKKVYDLLNAGHRHRFTVSGKIVSNCNFGYLFGMSPYGFMMYAKSDYGINLSIDEAEKWSTTFFNRYRRLRPFHRETIEFCKKYGYVESPLGRRRRLPDINSDIKGVRRHAENEAVNHPIQSPSSDTVLIACNQLLGRSPLNPKTINNLTTKEILHRLKFDATKDWGFLHPEECFPFMFVHDELVFMVKDGSKVEDYARLVKWEMENPPLERDFGVKLLVPLVAELKIGKESLAEMTEFKL